MTEPIRAAEVLAEAGYCWRDRPISQRVDDPLTMTEAQVDALLALHPEGDVVIRRDGTVAGLEWAYYSSEGEMHRLVPLSREADR